MATEGEFIDVSTAQDGGVKKRITQAAPEGAQGPPAIGNEVTAHYTGRLAADGSKFDSSVDRGTPLTFTVGVGQVIKGWDEGFASMKVGEKALLEITPEYGYGASGSPPKIPGNATLHFDVELLGFKEKHKEKDEMLPGEAIELAKKLKTEGTEFFQNKNYQDAVNKYKDAASYAVNEGTDEEHALYVSCSLNVAMCSIKLKEWADAVKACTSVLKMDFEEKNIKALYRRGLARINLGLLQEAKEDLMAVYNEDPQNKDVRKALASLKEAHAENKKKEKAAFGGIFNK
jgi:peptidylprolyl isomerase